jgi:hypothetical protein
MRFIRVDEVDNRPLNRVSLSIIPMLNINLINLINPPKPLSTNNQHLHFKQT